MISILVIMMMLGQSAEQVAPVSPVAADAVAQPPMELMTPYKPKGVFVSPAWARKPDAELIARYYPDLAAILHIDGKAVISCLVHVSGRPGNCSIASESPTGLKFGSTTLRIAPTFRFTPMMDDGVPVSGGPVRIPLRFTYVPVDAPSPKPLTYDQALYCVAWHAVRQKYLPGDSLSAAGLRRAEQLVVERRPNGSAAKLDADLETALKGQVDAEQRLKADRPWSGYCIDMH